MFSFFRNNFLSSSSSPTTLPSHKESDGIPTAQEARQQSLDNQIIINTRESIAIDHINIAISQGKTNVVIDNMLSDDDKKFFDKLREKGYMCECIHFDDDEDDLGERYECRITW